MSEKQIDFLAVGDIVVDAFIELQDAQVHCNVNNADCTLSMRFGDKIPYKNHYVLPGVGNSANAAVSAARLGISSALIAHVGDDRYGDDCQDELAKNGVITDAIVSEAGKPTNYHYVLWYKPERTILVKHTEFAYDWKLDIARTGKPKWLYLSSLAQHTELYHRDIADWVNENPDVNVAFQPGTFQMSLDTDLLDLIYTQTNLLCLNVEEAEKVSGVAEVLTDKGTPEFHNHVRQMSGWFHNKGVKIVAITDGPNGAYVSDGATLWFMPAYPDPAIPLERTGAGDAFASTMTVALMLGKTIPEALQWGPINSMNVVQHIGAQAGLLTREALEIYLAKKPATYTPMEL